MKMYSDLKAGLEKMKLLDFPDLVILELHTFCNLRCRMCPQHLLERKGQEMNFDIVRKVVDEIVAENRGTQLWVAVMGEPFMRVELLRRCLDYAAQKGVQDIRINTNGTCLKPEMTDWIPQYPIKYIYVGIDASTKETFEKIRVGGDFDLVVRNTKMLLKQKWDHPKIVVQYIVQDLNEHEVEDFRNFWLKQGAIVKVRDRISWGVYSDFRDSKPDRSPCLWLMRDMNILVNGDVLQCGADIYGKYPVGNIKEQTIAEIWKSEMRRRQQLHLDGEFDFEPCKNCQDWQVGISQTIKPDK